MVSMDDDDTSRSNKGGPSVGSKVTLARDGEEEAAGKRVILAISSFQNYHNIFTVLCATHFCHLSHCAHPHIYMLYS